MMTSLVCGMRKGPFHLSELTSLRELVLIGTNRKQQANLTDFARDPCMEYTQ